jgi:hypothetical protein
MDSLPRHCSGEISLYKTANPTILVYNSASHLIVLPLVMKFLAYLALFLAGAEWTNAHTIGQRISIDGVVFPYLHAVRAPRLNWVSPLFRYTLSVAFHDADSHAH